MESKHDESFDEEEIIVEATGSAEDNEFDSIVGNLEEILLEGRLSAIQDNFCDRHCDVFEDNDENKIEYTRIFEEYVETIEKALDSMLSQRVPGFEMQRFEAMLVQRSEEISGEIFDLMMSLGEFSEFKDLILNYKRMKTAKKGRGGDLSLSGHHISSP